MSLQIGENPRTEIILLIQQLGINEFLNIVADVMTPSDHKEICVNTWDQVRRAAEMSAAQAYENAKNQAWRTVQD